MMITLNVFTRAFVDVDHVEVDDSGPFCVIFAFFSLIFVDGHADAVVFHIQGKSLGVV